MPAATLKPPKRILGDSTKVHSNANPTLPSPSSAKRRKLDLGSSPAPKPRSGENGVNGKFGSSQPKSQFEEVLEKLTQDIHGLKKNNSERDQQWERPSLDDFERGDESLCFQQVEAEEGTIHGGKTTVKLFGVTEVLLLPCPIQAHADWELDRSLCFAPCNRLSSLSLRCSSSLIWEERLRWL